MIKNPIMFTVEVVTFVMLPADRLDRRDRGTRRRVRWATTSSIFLVLLATVLFANFAEAIAEARGKAQADSLRKTREETPAKRDREGRYSRISSAARRCARATCSNASRATPFPPTARLSRGWPRSTKAPSRANRAPVIREAGGDKSSVTGGTKVLSDRILRQSDRTAGREFPRQDDRPRRRRLAAENSERDCADHPAGRASRSYS